MSSPASGAGPRPHPMPRPMPGAKPRRALALAWLALALLWFLPLDTPYLLNPDEGRYAEIPREMLVSGDWVTPRLDGIEYFEKPPLQYWTTAVAFEVAGLHAWTARLWSALCGFLGLALTFLIGRRLYGERAARFGVIVQAGALLYAGLARVATLDMGLCFTLQMAMSALALLVHGSAAQPADPVDPASPANPADPVMPDRRLGSGSSALLLALGVALAMLSKGLIGIVIPGVVALLYMLTYRDAGLLLRAKPWWSLAALGALAAPWFVLVSRRHPGFAQFFFIFEHFQRFTSRAQFNRYEPPWFFVPVLAVGLLPWLTLLPRTLLEGVRAARAERATGLLLLWAGFVFVFFSLSQSKLATYILPMVPALSLLMGRSLARLPAARLAAHLGAVAAAAALALIAALLITHWPRTARLVAGASASSEALFMGALALLAAGAAAGSYCCRRGRPLLGGASAALGALLLVEAVLLGLAQLPRAQAERQLSRQLSPFIDRYRHFYCVNLYVQTAPFYLRRTCTLVAYRGELDYGLSREPRLGIDTLGQFAALWKRERSALAILRAGDYQRLQSLGAPMHVIYTAPSFVAVVRE